MTSITPADATSSHNGIAPGLYHANEQGELHMLPYGNWRLNDDGNPEDTSGWKAIVDRIPWERADAVFGTMNKWTAIERVARTVLTLSVAAGIIGAAVYLAAIGIVEGQAVVGFLGAAIGYLLARAGQGG